MSDTYSTSNHMSNVQLPPLDDRPFVRPSLNLSIPRGQTNHVTTADSFLEPPINNNHQAYVDSTLRRFSSAGNGSANSSGSSLPSAPASGPQSSQSSALFREFIEREFIEISPIRGPQDSSQIPRLPPVETLIRNQPVEPTAPPGLQTSNEEDRNAASALMGIRTTPPGSTECRLNNLPSYSTYVENGGYATVPVAIPSSSNPASTPARYGRIDSGYSAQNSSWTGSHSHSRSAASTRARYHPYAGQGSIDSRRLPELQIPTTSGANGYTTDRNTTGNPEREGNVFACYAGSDCQGENPRKCISHLFGRNKSETKRIPDSAWLWHCRKHYQRNRYNATKESVFYESQLKVLRDQLAIFERVMGDITWRIQWTSNLDRRLNAANRNRQAGPVEDDVRGAQLLDHRCGDNKTTTDVHSFINHMEQLIASSTISGDLLKVEFLPTRWTGEQRSSGNSLL